MSGTTKVDYDPQYGVAITFPDPSNNRVSHTPTWSIAGWAFQFVTLAPHCEYAINPHHGEVYFAKVMSGTLGNLAEGTTVTSPKERRSLKLPLGLTALRAGVNGACFLSLVGVGRSFSKRVSYVNG